MSMNMQNRIPLKYDPGHSGKEFADDQKFISSPGLNRIMNQKHVLINKLELKTN